MKSSLKQDPKFAESSKEVDKIVDGLGMHIDDGIKDAVAAFRALGFQTSASCEGHRDRALPYPWIDFRGEKSSSEDATEKAPAPLRELMEQLAEFSDAHEDLDVSGFVYNKREDGPRFSYSIDKKGKKYIIYDLLDDGYSEKEINENKQQLRRFHRLLSEFYSSQSIPYEDLLFIDVWGSTGAFRLMPLSGGMNELLPKKEQEAALKRHRQLIWAFAEYIYRLG